MLFKNLLPGLAIIAAAVCSPLPSDQSNSAELVYYQKPNITWIDAPEGYILDKSLHKRAFDEFVDLENGNSMEWIASTGSATQGWTSEDYAALYDQAGRVLTTSIAFNQRANIGVTFGMTDHAGHRHQIDAECTTTGEATVSLQGAFDNVGAACFYAELSADDSNTGLINTARNIFRIFFGTNVAISVGINVLN
jgi:hypothetical protein